MMLVGEMSRNEVECSLLFLLYSVKLVCVIATTILIFAM